MIGFSCTPRASCKKVVGTHAHRAQHHRCGFALPRDAGRRPAKFSRWGLQAVPALLRGWRCAMSRASRSDAGQSSRWGREDRRSQTAAPSDSVAFRRYRILTATGRRSLTGGPNSLTDFPARPHPTATVRWRLLLLGALVNGRLRLAPRRPPVGYFGLGGPGVSGCQGGPPCSLAQLFPLFFSDSSSRFSRLPRRLPPKTTAGPRRSPCSTTGSPRWRFPLTGL